MNRRERKARICMHTENLSQPRRCLESEVSRLRHTDNWSCRTPKLVAAQPRYELVLKVRFSVYNFSMLLELQKDDIVRMKKIHPCGSYEWRVTRLGADIGLECKGCGRRILLTRRELARRAKIILPGERQGNEHSP